MEVILRNTTVNNNILHKEKIRTRYNNSNNNNYFNYEINKDNDELPITHIPKTATNKNTNGNFSKKYNEIAKLPINYFNNALTNNNKTNNNSGSIGKEKAIYEVSQLTSNKNIENDYSKRSNSLSINNNNIYPNSNTTSNNTLSPRAFINIDKNNSHVKVNYQVHSQLHDNTQQDNSTVTNTNNNYYTKKYLQQKTKQQQYSYTSSNLNSKLQPYTSNTLLTNTTNTPKNNNINKSTISSNTIVEIKDHLENQNKMNHKKTNLNQNTNIIEELSSINNTNNTNNTYNTNITITNNNNINKYQEELSKLAYTEEIIDNAKCKSINNNTLYYNKFNTNNNNNNNNFSSNSNFNNYTKLQSQAYLNRRHLQAKEKTNKLQREKEEHEVREVTLKPRINKTSEKITSQLISNNDVFSRLTSNTEIRKRKENIMKIESQLQDSFKPKINEKSMALKRTVKDLLDWNKKKENKRSISIGVVRKNKVSLYNNENDNDKKEVDGKIYIDSYSDLSNHSNHSNDGDDIKKVFDNTLNVLIEHKNRTIPNKKLIKDNSDINATTSNTTTRNRIIMKEGIAKHKSESHIKMKNNSISNSNRKTNVVSSSKNYKNDLIRNKRNSNSESKLNIKKIKNAYSKKEEQHYKNKSKSKDFVISHCVNINIGKEIQHNNKNNDVIDVNEKQKRLNYGYNASNNINNANNTNNYRYYDDIVKFYSENRNTNEDYDLDNNQEKHDKNDFELLGFNNNDERNNVKYENIEDYYNNNYNVNKNMHLSPKIVENINTNTNTNNTTNKLLSEYNIEDNICLSEFNPEFENDLRNNLNLLSERNKEEDVNKENKNKKQTNNSNNSNHNHHNAILLNNPFSNFNIKKPAFHLGSLQYKNPSLIKDFNIINNLTTHSNNDKENKDSKEITGNKLNIEYSDAASTFKSQNKISKGNTINTVNTVSKVKPIKKFERVKSTQSTHRSKSTGRSTPNLNYNANNNKKSTNNTNIKDIKTTHTTNNKINADRIKPTTQTKLYSNHTNKDTSLNNKKNTKDDINTNNIIDNNQDKNNDRNKIDYSDIRFDNPPVSYLTQLPKQNIKYNTEFIKNNNNDNYNDNYNNNYNKLDFNYREEPSQETLKTSLNEDEIDKYLKNNYGNNSNKINKDTKSNISRQDIIDKLEKGSFDYNSIEEYLNSFGNDKDAKNNNNNNHSNINKYKSIYKPFTCTYTVNNNEATNYNDIDKLIKYSDNADDVVKKYSTKLDRDNRDNRNNRDSNSHISHIQDISYNNSHSTNTLKTYSIKDFENRSIYLNNNNTRSTNNTNSNIIKLNENAMFIKQYEKEQEALYNKLGINNYNNNNETNNSINHDNQDNHDNSSSYIKSIIDNNENHNKDNDNINNAINKKSAFSYENEFKRKSNNRNTNKNNITNNTSEIESSLMLLNNNNNTNNMSHVNMNTDIIKESINVREQLSLFYKNKK